MGLVGNIRRTLAMLVEKLKLNIEMSKRRSDKDDVGQNHELEQLELDG